MAIFNTVTVRFYGNVAINQSFTISYLEGGVKRRITYTVVGQRLTNNQVSIGSDVGGFGTSKQTSFNFASAFNADYGAVGFGATVPFYSLLDVYDVTIKAPDAFKNPNFETFIDEFSLSPSNGAVTFVLGYEQPLEVIKINTISFVADPTDRCNKIKAVVTTNYQATNIASPYNASVNTNPFEIELDRNSNYIVTVANLFTNASSGISTPPLLDIASVIVTVNSNPYSNSINITYNGMIGLALEYSLDGVNWQYENNFEGLLSGEFTLYVRDQYGCQKTKVFIIESSFTKIYVPYFYCSKSNSIRYAYRINFGDAGNYKNDENTLSYEADVLLPYMQEQLLQSADVITTQIKSNYILNRVWVIQSNGNEIEVPVVKKTNNIGRKDSRDARIVNLGSNQSGVFFLSGNTYDYDTNQSIGNYTLNGLLPIYGKVGNWVQLNGVYYEITNVYYDENYNADVLVFNKVYNGPISNIIVKSEYNFEEFEVYEFTIDMVDYIDQKIQIKIQATDDSFTAINMLSEVIHVKVKHEETLEIKYYNDNNNDIFYQTGIRHTLRIPFTKVSGKNIQSNETYRTDTTAIVLSSEIHEANVFLF